MIHHPRLLPNLYALAVFEASGRWCNFTKAAQELNLTQPSVSRHVVNLEERLGVSLFDRRHNVLKLTPTGERLQQAVSFGYGHIRTELEAIARGQRRRPLTIACTPVFFAYWLVSRFSRLRETIDDTDIQVVLSEWFDGLDRDQVDVVVRWSESTWKNQEFIPIFTEEAYPVCSPAYWQAHLKGTNIVEDPAQLCRHPLLHLYTGESGFLSWKAWFAAFGVDYIQPPSAIPLSNFLLVLQSAREGLGIALGWTYLTDDLIESGELVQLAPSVRNDKMTYGLDFSIAGATSSRRKQLVDWFRSETPKYRRVMTS